MFRAKENDFKSFVMQTYKTWIAEVKWKDEVSKDLFCPAEIICF